MKDHFEGAIFEGVLFGSGIGGNKRGSSFGTAYSIPIYDPLCPSNIMTVGGLDPDWDLMEESLHIQGTSTL